MFLLSNCSIYGSWPPLFQSFPIVHNICCDIQESIEKRFIETALRHKCSPVNLLHIFRTPFLNKSTSEGLLLKGEHEHEMG